MLSHAVYFTLKDRSADAVAKLVASSREHLTGHPGCISFAVGRLADYDRQVNDRAFDVALEIIFESHEAHQTSDRHQQFIAANAETWAGVRVFDAVLETLERD
jgi:quinol monooxygenase YgiN